MPVNIEKLITRPVKYNREDASIEDSNNLTILDVANFNGDYPSAKDTHLVGEFIARAINDYREWTPVESGLPEADGEYLVTTSKGGFSWQRIGCFCRVITEKSFAALWFTVTEEEIDITDSVTAWRPLPEPYKSATDNN